MKSSATNLLWGVTLAGMLSLFVALGIAFLMGSRMTKPIELVTKLAGNVAKGDLHSARAHFLNLQSPTDVKGPDGSTSRTRVRT